MRKLLGWIYARVFAQRATWKLEKVAVEEREDGETVKVTMARYLTVYDPSLEDLEACWEHIRSLQEEGWVLIASPKEGRG